MPRNSIYKRACSVVGAGGLLAVLSASGCGATDSKGAPLSCSGLDTSTRALATVKAYGDACGALNTRAAEVEAKWLATCNAINADLGEDTSQTTTAAACAVLNRRVKSALDAG